MASNEVRRIYEVGRTNGAVTETQVRAGETTRFLRVIGEVSLAVFVGVVTDDFHRVLVGTYGTVGTEAVEFGFEHAFATHGDFFAHGQ